MGMCDKVRLRTLRKYGNFALAYSAAFQPGLDYFGGEEGLLAYKQVGSTAFVLANPLAPIGGCEDLIRSFMSERSDVCFWQASRPVAKILENIGFCVNEMGTETRVELSGYDFDGPRKRNFRRALNHAATSRYTIAERSVTSLDREELQTVSERWRQTRGVKNREMTFLTRPAILDDEIDVRKFFTFDQKGSLQAFAFFDPIYKGGEVVGYLCSAKCRLPETAVGCSTSLSTPFRGSPRTRGHFADQPSRLIALSKEVSPCRSSSRCQEHAMWPDLCGMRK